MNRPLLACHIRGTSELLPGEPVSTEQIARETGLDADLLRAKTGVTTRWRSAPGDTFVALATEAVRAALADADLAPDAVRRLIFTTSLGGDTVTQANANRVAAALGMRAYACFDVSNGCMGFLTALDAAARYLATGGGVTALVAVELPTRFVRPDDPRPYAVFGDGVGAAILVPHPGGGLMASWLGNDGGVQGQVELRSASATDTRTTLTFGASGRHMSELAVDLFRRAVDAALADAGLTLGDVDWVLPHQPNAPMFDRVVGVLGVPEDRLVRIVHEVGSIGSASIPISLHRLRSSGRLHPGQHVLMAGVGVGVSCGAAIYREPT